jgi:hypothetical protein
MNNRRDYDKAVAVVGEVIRRWDPYSLIKGGAPSDEFELEIAKVVAHIPRIGSSADAVKALSTVFSQAFEPDLFTETRCAVPGNELFAALSAANLCNARKASG